MTEALSLRRRIVGRARDMGLEAVTRNSYGAFRFNAHQWLSTRLSKRVPHKWKTLPEPLCSGQRFDKSFVRCTESCITKPTQEAITMFHIPTHKNVLNPPSQVAIAFADPVEARAFKNASSGMARVIALVEVIDRSDNDEGPLHKFCGELK